MTQTSNQGGRKRRLLIAGAHATLRPILERVRLNTFAHSDRNRAGEKHTERVIRNDEHLSSDDLEHHLNGGPACGAYPVHEGTSTTLVSLLDFDSHKGETSWDDLLAVAQKVRKRLIEHEMKPHWFRSSGGKGVHIYLIWDTPQDARSVRLFLRDVLAEFNLRDGPAGVVNKQVEVFPKQNYIEPDKFGNMFVLPLAFKSAPLDENGDVLPRDTAVRWDVSPSVDMAPPEPPREPAEAPPGVNWRHVTGLLGDLSPELSRGPGSGHECTWMGVMMAVNSATQGSAKGLEIFHEWSAEDTRADQYDEKEIDKQWRDLGRRHEPKPITIRSLERWARDARTRKAMKEGFDDLDEVNEEEARPERQPGQAMLFSEVIASDLKPIPYLIHDFLPEAVKGEQEAVVLLGGPWGSGKSFLTLDMAHVLSGGRAHWHDDGDLVKTCGVYYYAAEDPVGVRLRMKALHKRGGVDKLPLSINTSQFDLSTDDGWDQLILDLKSVVKRWDFSTRMRAVFIDTMNASNLLSDENNTEAATVVMHKLARFSRKHGVTLIVVVHYGKNLDAGIRGSSAQPSNANAYYEVNDIDTKKRTGALEVKKIKGGPIGARFPFQLEVVQLGLDPKDRPITTCLVEWHTEAVKAAKTNTKTLEEVQRTRGGARVAFVFKAIQDFRELNPSLDIVSLDDVYEFVKCRLPKPAKGHRDNRSRDARDRVKSLIEDREKYAFVNFQLVESGKFLVWDEGF